MGSLMVQTGISFCNLGNFLGYPKPSEDSHSQHPKPAGICHAANGTLRNIRWPTKLNWPLKKKPGAMQQKIPAVTGHPALPDKSANLPANQTEKNNAVSQNNGTRRK